MCEVNQTILKGELIMKKVIYIYNLKQSAFYMSNGVMPLSVGKHERTRRIFHVFNRDESQEVFKMWCERERE